jgi:putative FmdB family regulatory protein
MPVYDYHCVSCGDFQDFRTIEDRNAPASCPNCAATARRLILAPNLALMNPSRRHAFATNERSRHEPKVSTGHSCGSGCGCGSPAKVRPTRMKETKLGKLQSQKATARPWMLGH